MRYLEAAKEIFRFVLTLKTRRKTARQALKQWLVFITVGSVVYAYRLADQAGLIDLISTAWIEKNPILFVTIGCSATFLIGRYLNIFKRKNQQLYGFTEIILSLFVAGSIVYNDIDHDVTKLSTPELVKLIVPFLTAIYFTQRGFNNYIDGRDKVKKEEKQKAEVSKMIEDKLREMKELT